MITRRDALRLAALAAAGGAGPFAVPPERAAALLDGPAAEPVALAPGVPDGGLWHPGEPTYDPAGFAADVALGQGLGEAADLLSHVAPEEVAEYKRALAALYRDLPVLRAVPFDHPIHKLDEAVLAGFTGAYQAGARVGAVAEHLRLAALGPRRECRRCDGSGALSRGKPFHPGLDDAADEVCPGCGGRGTVATPAPALPAGEGA